VSIGLPIIGRLWKIKRQQKRVKELVTFLAKRDDTWIEGTSVWQKPEAISTTSFFREEIDLIKRQSDQQQRTTSQNISSDTPLILAAKNGIIEIVEIILQLYPQAVEHVNAAGENIFHVAARYRRKEILDLLQHSDVPRWRLNRMLNEEGDSILHQAAHYSKDHLRDRPGEALLMQSEILWFKVLILLEFWFPSIHRLFHFGHKFLTIWVLRTSTTQHLKEVQVFYMLF
jgi:hypothetical protein